MVKVVKTIRRLMEDITFEEIKRLQQGEKQVFNRIMRLYKNRMLGLCLKYMGNIEEARDMAQEIFCAAYSAIKSFEFRAKFSTWIYRLAVNRCINKLKAGKRRRAVEYGQGYKDDEDYAEKINNIAEKGKLPDELIEFQELRSVILNELEKFPEKERSIIILLDMEELSCDEIGKILGMPAGTVMSMASRTRHKLKKWY